MTTDTWKGGGDNWDIKAGWSAGLPTSTSAVVIDSGDPLVTSAFAVASITLSGNGFLSFDDSTTCMVSGTVDNAGYLGFDVLGGGGSGLTIGGALTNSGFIQIGDDAYGVPNPLTATDRLQAASIDNTGQISLTNTNSQVLAELVVTGAASLGASAGVLSGDLSLIGYSLVEFGGGQITTIASGATLSLDGAGCFIADAGSLTSDSALKGLADIAVNGNVYLAEQQIATTSGLIVAGNLLLDSTPPAQGGSHLAIGGALAISGQIVIGNYGLNANDGVSATSLDNTGSITLIGDDTVGAANRATLDISGAASLGAGPGVIDGYVRLEDDALIEFGHGEITSIDIGATLMMFGADVYIADAGALTSNSALKGLATNDGMLSLDDGVAITTSGAMTNAGQIQLDTKGFGGSRLTFGGALRNSGLIRVGGGAILKAASVDDSTAGQIVLSGDALSGGAAELLISSSATLGATAGLISGEVIVEDDALLEFGGGQITTISSSGYLALDGYDSFVADAGSLTSNSALKGLTVNDGAFLLTDQSVTTSVGLTNAGQLQLAFDSSGGEGGVNLTIGGALTNSGNITIYSQYGGVSADGVISSASFESTGYLLLEGDDQVGKAFLAELDIAGLASLGKSAGVVNGDDRLSQDALIEFGSGQITTIASGATLAMSGKNVFIADAGSLNSSSALKGLATNDGTFELDDGVTVAISSSFSNAGQIFLDSRGSGLGGSRLTIGGTLTNIDQIDFGAAGDVLQAAHVNNTGGAIYVTDDSVSGGAAELQVTGAAALGAKAGVLAGTVFLQGNSLIVFGSGQITTIAASAELSLVGPDDFVADAGSLTSNSALQGLASVVGTLSLDDSLVVTKVALNNTGAIYLDQGGVGGADLAIGGALTNSGTIGVGGVSLSVGTTLTAASVDNAGGSIGLKGDVASAALAELQVNGAASLGASAGVLAGAVSLSGDAAVVFASGQIASIAAGGALTLTGDDAFVADVGRTTSNSALLGLAQIFGTLDFENDESLTTNGALTNSGALDLDQLAGDGGSRLAIKGLFDNAGQVTIGNYASTTPTSLTAAALDNAGGTIDLDDVSTGEVSLTINGAATNSGTINDYDDSVSIAGALTNSGTLNIGASNETAAATLTAASLNNSGGTINLAGVAASHLLGELKLGGAASLGTRAGVLAGDVNLSGDARIQFASGQITSIAANSELTLSGVYAWLADAGSSVIDSALKTLGEVDGTFDLESGASLASDVGLINKGFVYLDIGQTGDNGGSHLAIGGAFDNAGTVWIGNNGLAAAASVSATSLDNAGGTIDLFGDAAGLALLSITGAAVNTGAIDIGASDYVDISGALTGSGEVSLSNGGSLSVGAAGGGGTISFGGSVGHVVVTEGDSFDDAMEAFAVGDNIRFTSVNYASTDVVKFQENSATNGGIVLIDTNLGAQVARFEVLGSYGATNFHLGEDSAGHISIAYKA